MDRRSLLKQTAAAGMFIGLPSTIQFFISSCNSDKGPGRVNFLSEKQFEVLERICDILIPETSTPGAAQTRAAYFAELAVKDCVPAIVQEQVKNSLTRMEEEQFLKKPSGEQQEIISKLDADAFKENSGMDWYKAIKKLACIGHFTSELTGKTALEYRAAWGTYQPCIDYKKGDKAMAKNFLLYY